MTEINKFAVLKLLGRKAKKTEGQPSMLPAFQEPIAEDLVLEPPSWRGSETERLELVKGFLKAVHAPVNIELSVSPGEVAEKRRLLLVKEVIHENS